MYMDQRKRSSKSLIELKYASYVHLAYNHTLITSISIYIRSEPHLTCYYTSLMLEYPAWKNGYEQTSNSYERYVSNSKNFDFVSLENNKHISKFKSSVSYEIVPLKYR